MSIICLLYTSTGSHPTEAGKAIGTYVDLDTLYAQSDIISLHCPLFPENREMINKDAIAKMKDGVILLNTARGALIVEQDVADALNSGKIYAAGLDVAAVEPLPATSPLLTAKNCIMTPHIAWATKEARQRLMNIAVDNLRCFLDGKPCLLYTSGRLLRYYFGGQGRQVHLHHHC